MQAEIEALAGDRVDHMGRVAEQRQALGDEASGDAEGQGEGLRLRLEGDPAELQPEAALEFDEQIFGMAIPAGPARSRLRSVQTMEERCWTVPSACASAFSGRMAKGPEGRKCSTALPSWSRSWAMVATMPDWW